MDEHFVIEYEMTEELAAKLSRLMLDRHFYSRVFHRHGPLAVAALVGALIALFAFQLIDRNAFGFFLAVIGILVGYVWFRRMMLFRDFQWLWQMSMRGRENSKVRLSLSATLLTMRAGGEEYEADWSELASVWIIDEFWVLRLKLGHQFFIPTANITPPLEELIRQKAQLVEASIVED